MCRQTRIVSDLCIRCHLSRAFTPCPFLGGGYKCSPNSPLSIFCIDKPALQITHVVGFTVFDEGPDTGLKKTGKLSVASVRHNHKLRVGVIDNVQHLSLMVVITCCVPQLPS